MYTDFIKELAPAHDARHVLAYMLIAHSTLDGLSASEFRKEAQIGVECIKAGGIEAAERCAKSFGL